MGYNEHDAIRGDDSWKSFDEVMCLARERDVDMVLLAGDLFHENKPSKKSLYQVMRSLRMNCLSDKPVELEMISSGRGQLDKTFDYVNYEDTDINVGIPVFSIHGNHDDPAGDGHFSALDLLQISGLLNYFGRTPEADNIQIKPVLMRKGRTYLALYGMSNVRDERLHRTFRDGGVTFFRPSTHRDDWFNLLSVHQNHYSHTITGYLPEEMLPDFMNLVVWGHEHECLINPRLNSEMEFYVIQPGSSVATSLVPAEAVPKEVAILKITGHDFEVEPIRLKSVRPFVTKEIVLAEEKGVQKLARKENNRTDVTRFLITIVEELIAQANQEWMDMHSQDGSAGWGEIPLPLVRLRVDTSAPDGGHFECENPQRFSNRFVGKVANVNDVIQFHRRRRAAMTTTRTGNDVPEEASLENMSLDRVKVDELVNEFLSAQTLSILPQNSFTDAISQFVDKDDKQVMESFVNSAIESQFQHLMSLQDGNDEIGEESSLQEAMSRHRKQMEQAFSRGQGLGGGRNRPDGWDSDFDSPLEDQPRARRTAAEEDDEPTTRTATRGRGRGRGRAALSRVGTSGRGAKKTASISDSRPKSRRRASSYEEEEEEEEEDHVMVDADDDEEEEEE